METNHLGISQVTAQRVHVDTNFLVEIAFPDSPAFQQLTDWMSGGKAIHVSAMAWAEFQCGAMAGITEQEDTQARAWIGGIIEISQSSAELAAKLFNATGRRSRMLADCIIAATAILSDAPLATANAEDFQPFLSHGLRLAI